MTAQPPVSQPPAGGDPNSAFTMVTLNYWLSVFFIWVPALIFFLVEKGKNSTIDAHNRANLNFQILRTIVLVAGSILGAIPYLGWLFGLVLWAASVVLFVFAIIAAVKGPEEARAGREYKYPFNVEFVK
jgi:uncharacterized Tic20 family protein